jgi:hypothetical protein
MNDSIVLDFKNTITQSACNKAMYYVYSNTAVQLNFAYSLPICSVINSKVHICINPNFIVHIM